LEDEKKSEGRAIEEKGNGAAVTTSTIVAREIIPAISAFRCTSHQARTAQKGEHAKVNEPS
jgi:hypothetical protein